MIILFSLPAAIAREKAGNRVIGAALVLFSAKKYSFVII
jgi:hypothetical protein